MNYPTPHINATPDDFGQTVLMPGDPLRSKFIAENFLENIRLVNNVRGVQGYTGYYKGMKISVMASGMGIPSIGIYSYELYNAYGVRNIMRIGSAGSINPNIHVRDILVAEGACTDSNFAHHDGVPEVLQTVPAWIRMGVMACEMEAAGLYMNAARAGKNALCLCTVSDHMLTGESLPASERQTSFTEMMGIALETALKLEK